MADPLLAFPRRFIQELTYIDALFVQNFWLIPAAAIFTTIPLQPGSLPST